MKRTLAVCILLFLTGIVAAAPSFEGFETDTGDWVFDIGGSGRVASGGGLLGVPSASGSFHAELINAHDYYLPGYGTAGYSFFGGADPVYQGKFYQAIDVYIDPTWSGLGFWIDMSPRDIIDESLWAAEGNFRLTADGASVAVQAINGPVLANLTLDGLRLVFERNQRNARRSQ